MGSTPYLHGQRRLSGRSRDGLQPNKTLLRRARGCLADGEGVLRARRAPPTLALSPRDAGQVSRLLHACHLQPSTEQVQQDCCVEDGFQLRVDVSAELQVACISGR